MLQSFPNPSVLFIFFFHFSRARFPALLFLGLIDIFFFIYSGNDGVFPTVTGPTQTHRHTDIQIHRHTDTQTYRYTDTQTHRHTDTQTHRHRHATVRLNAKCVQFRNVKCDAKYTVSTILSARTM